MERLNLDTNFKTAILGLTSLAKKTPSRKQ